MGSFSKRLARLDRHGRDLVNTYPLIVGGWEGMLAPGSGPACHGAERSPPKLRARQETEGHTFAVDRDLYVDNNTGGRVVSTAWPLRSPYRVPTRCAPS